MKVERINFREFGSEVQVETATGPRMFHKSGRSTQREEVPPPPPPPPVFSEEDMKSAERDGYKKGFLEGVKEGRQQTESEQAEINRRLTDMAEQFAQAVTPLFTDYRQMALQLNQDTPRLALTIARKVAGVALRQRGQDVIADIATRCCEAMISEANLTITVHESMGDTLEAQFQQIASRLPSTTSIIIVRDPTMPLTDCRIEWEQGSMEHSNEQLWQQVEKVISDMVVTATRDTNAHMEELKQQLPPSHNDTNPKE